MKFKILLFFLLSLKYFYSQSDSLVNLFSDKLVLYSDVGINACPFNIDQINSVGESLNFKYRSNLKPFIGVGGHYKIFSLRIGALLNYNMLNENKYGNTNVFKLGTEVYYKKFYFDLDYYKNKGYAITNLNETQNIQSNLYPDLIFKSISLNAWYFFNSSFNLNALKGRNASVKKRFWSFYLKETNALTNIYNSSSIILFKYQDVVNSNSSFYKINAFEIGIIPGIAFAANVKNKFQFGGLFGYGGVLIDKSIHFTGNHRNYVGFSKRFDFHFLFGYNSSKYFVMNYIDLENRQISFTHIDLLQKIVGYRLLFGVRF